MPAVRLFTRFPAGRWSASALLAATLAAATAPAQEVGAEADFAEENNPLAVAPQNDVELVRAAIRLRGIGRPRLAKSYLEQLLASNPTDEALLALRAELGPGAFVGLANDRDLRPASAELLGRITDAFRERANDPVVIGTLIDDLFGSRADAAAAEGTLRANPEVAAPALTQRLADDARVTEHATLIRLLGDLGADAVGPLSALVRNGSEAGVARAARALGATGAASALDPLLRPAFDPSLPATVRDPARQAVARVLRTDPVKVERETPAGAARVLAERAGELLDRAADLDPARDADAVDPDDRPVAWTWDDGRLVRGTVSPARALLWNADRLALDAVLLNPTRRDLRTLRLLTALSLEADRAGYGGALPEGPGTVSDAARAADPSLPGDVLREALARGLDGAAAAALSILGRSGGADLLRPDPRGTSPILDALDSRDPHVRFLAAVTVARLDPPAPAPAADRVVRTLAESLADEPARSAVVVDPNRDRGLQMAALLRGLGYEVDAAETGRAGFARAAADGGVELVAVSLQVNDWPLLQTVSNFRRDARTAAAPVAVYGDERLLDRVGATLRADGGVALVRFPTTEELLRIQLDPLRRATAVLPGAVGAEQRAGAGYWLARLARRRDGAFPLAAAETPLTRAVSDPDLAANAASALAAIPTPGAQRALAQAVRGGTLPDGLRADVATQLGDSLRRFGTLLTGDELASLAAVEADAPEPLAGSLRTALAAARDNPLDTPAVTDLRPELVP